VGTTATDVITITGTEVDGSVTNELNIFTTDDSEATEGTAITIAGGGIATTSESADTITITATEADTLDTVSDRGSTTDQAITTGGVTVTTGTHITVGTTQWDDGSDAIDGEQVADNTIDDDSIDFGTGATQVSAGDLPIADAGTIITATEVEGALQENRTAIDLNTIHSTDNTQAHTDYLINNGNDTTSGILTSAGIIVGDGQTVGATTNKWLFDDTNGDISTTGNVGIGTTAPGAYKLHVEGGMIAQAYTTGDIFFRATMKARMFGGCMKVRIG